MSVVGGLKHRTIDCRKQTIFSEESVEPVLRLVKSRQNICYATYAICSLSTNGVYAFQPNNSQPNWNRPEYHAHKRLTHIVRQFFKLSTLDLIFCLCVVIVGILESARTLHIPPTSFLHYQLIVQLYCDYTPNPSSSYLYYPITLTLIYTFTLHLPIPPN